MTASLLARRAFARVVIFLACLLGLAMLPARADDTAASMYVGLGASGYAPVIVPLRPRRPRAGAGNAVRSVVR